MSIIIDLKMTSKKCSKCDIVKDFREFYKDKSRKDGYRNRCKICHSESKKVKDSKVEYKPKPKVQEKVVVVECNECYKCTKCNILKKLNEFHKEKNKKNGCRSACKECVKTKAPSTQKEKRELLSKNNSKVCFFMHVFCFLF